MRAHLRPRLIASSLLWVFTLAGLVGLAFARRFAVKVVTPPGNAVYDLDILSIRGGGDSGQIVTLPRNPDTQLSGEYSLVSVGGADLTLVGDIVSCSSKTVDRRVLRVSGNPLVVGDKVKFCGWTYLHPNELKLPWTEIVLRVEEVDLPAWVVFPDQPVGETWTIHIHGRATRRSETLRSAGITASCGMTSVVVTYRNDEEVTGGNTGHSLGRYDLGSSEWRDVEAAVDYALEHGANNIVLYGWSMGAAIAAQLYQHSAHRDKLVGAIFDSPALDWREVLAFQGRLAHLPNWITAIGLWMLTSGVVRAGSTGGLDLSNLNAVAQLKEASLPLLILHSVVDGYVPIDAAERLAHDNRLVTLERFADAGHVKLWNADRARYERDVKDWLKRTLARPTS